ncbi:partial Type I secretion system ATP-binding protein PrsD, partial [Methylococcales bacterium]
MAAVASSLVLIGLAVWNKVATRGDLKEASPESIGANQLNWAGPWPPWRGRSLGIYRPEQGSIRLDGADIHNWERVQRGSFLGYLPQDVELLDGTISANIARFGEIDADKIVEAALM